MSFREVCERVCRDQGWELLPAGIQVRWGDGRRQLIDLEFFDYESEPRVRFSTTIGNARELGDARLTASLRLNSELAHGALAIRGERLVMIQTSSIEASEEEIRTTVNYLAETADYYEEKLFGTDDH